MTKELVVYFLLQSYLTTCNPQGDRSKFSTQKSAIALDLSLM
ncbi:hypothetical protein ACE1CD_26550 [Aerosakkonema sp. BLCC-F183]